MYLLNNFNKTMAQLKFFLSAIFILCFNIPLFTSGYPQLINPQISSGRFLLPQKIVLTQREHAQERQEYSDFFFDSEENSAVATTATTTEEEAGSDICSNLPSSIRKEIQGYQKTANQIMDVVLNGAFKGRTYKELGYFVDRFGSRLAGTDNLERAIDYMLDKLKQDGLSNVHGEEVNVPHWVRGEERATLTSPRRKDLSILGLGYTVGTGPSGITAPVLVVKSFDDLKNRSDEAKGKIIVYNEDYHGYGPTVTYRGHGAQKAQEVGAVAALIRSVTPFSIYSPHTGMMDAYEEKLMIPCACITIEDAELLERLQNSGEKLVINLLMNDTTLEDKKSRNSVAEIIGREKPEDVVVISGHLDSWDVGQGAMDDGGGAFISAEVLALLNWMDLKPRRTIRTILWTSEELGLIGAQQYVEKHAAEMPHFTAVFESDIGTFKPLGLDFAGSPASGCLIKEILKLLEPINATTFRAQSDVGSDIGEFIKKGVPGLSLNNANEKYFWYHHSNGDTMTVLDQTELDLCTAVWAITSFVVADMSVDLRDNHIFDTLTT